MLFMKLSYFALQTHEPELNLKQYTNTDIYRIFKRDRVHLAYKNIEVCGYYEVDKKGRESVVINSELRGLEHTRTLCHEGVHHYIDFPVTDEVVKLCRTMDVLQRRQDINAEVLSLIMIFPFYLLENFIKTGILPSDLEPYLAERLFILDYYGV